VSANTEVHSGLPAVREEANGNGALSSVSGSVDSVQQLLQLAIERSTPVEALEKLVALRERIEDRDAKKAFIQDLAAFKAKCPPIVHSKSANFATRGGARVNYSYTELDELARVIDPVLTEFGFSYGWDERLDKGMVTTTCTLYHVGGHSRTSSFTLPADNDSAASPQQKIGMADTYASRRSLIAVLGLTTADKDPRPAEVDPTLISEDQLTHLADLMEETKIDQPKFLAYLNVAKLSELRAARYHEALSALEQKKRERAKRSRA
jgi:hypothetical protein